jgi:hypothetical protein
MSNGIPLDSDGLLPDFYFLCFKNYILKKSGRIPVDSAGISLDF